MPKEELAFYGNIIFFSVTKKLSQPEVNEENYVFPKPTPFYDF
jgi:hypothetical protein